MITSLVYNGVKGKTLTTSLNKVNLITGENGSGKTSVLSAIQLALGQGVSDVGKSNAAIGLLLPESGSCYSAVATAKEGVYSTNVSRKKTTVSVVQTPPIDKDLFGGVPQVTDDFFGMSGDDKWKLIMKAASKNKDAANLDAATRKKFNISDDDIVGSLIKAIEDLKAKKKKLSADLEAARARLSVSPPECSVENIQEVNKKVSEYKAVLKSHYESKQRAGRRETNKAGYIREIEDLNRSIEENVQYLNTNKISIESLEKEISAIESYSKSQEYLKASKESDILKAIQGAKKLLDELNIAYPEFESEAIEYGVEYDAIVSGLDILVSKYIDAGNKGDIDLGYKLHVRKIELKKLSEAVDYWQNLENKAREKLDKLNNQLQSLLSEDLVLLSDEAVAELAKEVEALELKQGEFTRLEQYNKNQKEDMASVNKISEEIDLINEEISKLNEVREKIIERTIPVIEKEANKILRDIGLGEVVVKTESTASRVSLVIEDKDGVDMRTICRSRRVMYGAALLYAFHKVCEVKLSVIYVEAAELSAKYLYIFLESIQKNCEGTTFLVGHWAKPAYNLNPEILVVELV